MTDKTPAQVAETRLHRLRTTGFKPLRPGRIHYRCPGCGRKQSNMPKRDGKDGYPPDPKNAFLAETCCPKCCVGHKDCGVNFYDKRGREIDDSASW